MGNWCYGAIGHEEVTAKNLMRLFDNVEYADYNPTEEGCQAIIDEWKIKADCFDQRFKNIPGYVEGQHCIVLKYAWLRETNKKEIQQFSRYLDMLSNKLLVPVFVNGMNRDQYTDESSKLYTIINKTELLPANLINYHALQGYKERQKFVNKVLEDIPYWTEESYTKYTHLNNVSNHIYNYTSQMIDEKMACVFKENFPEAKIVVGQKTSKAVKKLCSMLGVDKDENWEKNYARYADAINPLQIDKNVCISWNLFDYLTMSQGNSWTSCHDIDSCGCYSSGTLSYALDSVSLVVYMLPDDYTESCQPLWNIPKVKRQMFHIREDGNLFIQGRLYPDDQTDHGYGCEFSAYENWRHMMQEIVAKAFNLNNLWKIKKGNDELEHYIYHNGTNYDDYFHYKNCNMSYLSEIEEKIDTQRISIGHNPICPSCGNEHNDTECCTCEDCREEKIACEDCGQRVRTNDAYYINGCYYCGNCVTYCEYHEAYKHATEDELTYIDEYGRVCDDGINGMIEDGYLYECEECGDYSLDRNTWNYNDTESDETYHFCTCHCRDRYVERNFPRMA